jgi:hypothetical protein
MTHHKTVLYITEIFWAPSIFEPSHYDDPRLAGYAVMSRDLYGCKQHTFYESLETLKKIIIL